MAQEDDMNTENKNSDYEELMKYLEEAQAYQTALILFEWDDETLAPEAAGSRTARMQGVLSASYQRIMMDPRVKELVDRCLDELEESRKTVSDGKTKEKEHLQTAENGVACSTRTDDTELTEENIRRAILKAAKREIEEVSCIPPEEYRAYQELTAKSTRIWTKARKENDFEAFAPVLQEIIDYQKKFASYRQKEGQKLYDVMLDSFEPGFTMEKLDEFFGLLKEHIVPLLKQVMESPVRIQDDFLDGDYPEEKQRELAEYLANYVGFDFSKGVLAVSAHPFTTNLHNRDVRITTHYKSRVDSSAFSVIHESGHAIYEFGIDDRLSQTPAGQGTSMGMHESQSRFFENTVAEVLNLVGEYSELNVRRCLAASDMLSSDVSAAFDPSYASAFEKKNAAFFGRGMVFNKFTGARGKSGSNDANAEYVAHIRAIMEESGVAFQTAELGKIDVGGGGTIAYILALYGMNVIDSGVAVLNMHAPYEVSSKADIYEAVKGYLAFLNWNGKF